MAGAGGRVELQRKFYGGHCPTRIFAEPFKRLSLLVFKLEFGNGSDRGNRFHSRFGLLEVRCLTYPEIVFVLKGLASGNPWFGTFVSTVFGTLKGFSMALIAP